MNFEEDEPSGHSLVADDSVSQAGTTPGDRDDDFETVVGEKTVTPAEGTSSEPADTLVQNENFIMPKKGRAPRKATPRKKAGGGKKGGGGVSKGKGKAVNQKTLTAVKKQLWNVINKLN